MSRPDDPQAAHLSAIILCATVVMLACFGLCMLYSTSAPVSGMGYFVKQAIYIVLGIIAATFIRLMDYRVLCRHAWVFVAIGGCFVAYLALANLAPSVAPYLPMVKKIKGAYRWINLGICNVQPSEFMKLALCLLGASYFGMRQRMLALRNGQQRGFRGASGMDSFGMREFWLPSLFMLGICGLTYKTGSLSMTVLTGALFATCMIVAGVRIRFIIGIIGIGVSAAASLALFDPVRMRRIISFLDPELTQRNEGFQLWYSFLALGSGGWTGMGFTESRLKNEYLPECHTDCIMSIVGEEMGFLAVIAVIIGYLVLLYSTFAIAKRARDSVGTILSACVGAAICQHAMVNFAVICGLGPTTGITAPFISYGGSSMISTFIGIGLILSVQRIAAQTPEPQPTPEKPPL